MNAEKEFDVSMPITGRVTRRVKAQDAQSAEAAFWDSIDEKAPTEDEIEWEYTDHVTRGNVCNAMQNDVQVDEIKERS